MFLLSESRLYSQDDQGRKEGRRGGGGNEDLHNPPLLITLRVTFAPQMEANLFLSTEQARW